MRPRLLLSLWRDRWRKPGVHHLQSPLVHGRITNWSRAAAAAALFSPRSARLVFAALAIATIGVAASIRFTLHDQAVIGGLLIAVAMVLRRYAGTIITLMLAALSILASTRYLSWRYLETLPGAGGMEYVLAVALWVAEAYLLLLWVSEFTHELLPLERPSGTGSLDTVALPPIDIFIIGHGHAADVVAGAIERAGALGGTEYHCKVHVLDAHARAEVAAVCPPSVRYLASADRADDLLELLFYAAERVNGAIIVALDATQAVDSASLRTATSWIVTDPQLGMVSTPRHVLIPPLSEASLRLLPEFDVTTEFACFRRSALCEVATLDADRKERADSDFMNAFHEIGYTVSYIRLGAYEQDERGRNSGGARPTRGKLPTRIDVPLSPRVLKIKRTAQFVAEMLRYYAVLPRLVFLSAPTAYFLLDAKLINATPGWLVAFAVPHLLHGYLFHTRARLRGRLSAGTELREALLACYLLIPTAVNLIYTFASRALRPVHGERLERVPLGQTFNLIPVATLCALNVVCVVLGTLEIFSDSHFEHGLGWLYLLWAAVNLLLLASVVAVAGEATQIRRHLLDRATLPAMLRLPFGRTISCTTRNFPAIELTIELPSPLEVRTGGPLTVSLFLEQEAFPFPARVVQQCGQTLQVRIDDAALPGYERLREYALSRGTKWPKWLPGREADRLIPERLIVGLTNATRAVLDFTSSVWRSTRRVTLIKRPLFRTRTDD